MLYERALIYAEMSEWFKEHDWKSCVRLKRTGGSNPLLCANKKHTSKGVFFLLHCEEIETFPHTRRFARTMRFIYIKITDEGS